jgi:alpha-D-ribose 1-methylphosphonate 5-triphosphate synthase subunit PhnG
MALLARAPVGLLEAGLSTHAELAPQWLRRPESGLMMVQGRVGGSGQRFNLGEVTVTRCTLRVCPPLSEVPRVGVAYVMGRSHRHARLAALADALLQDPEIYPVLELQLLHPLRQHQAQQQARQAADAQATRVDFFTVARESGACEEPESEDAE